MEVDIMKKYRVYGFSNGTLVSVYDELINASSQAEATMRAIQWNIEELYVGRFKPRFNPRYNRIEYYNDLGELENTITHIAAIAR